MSVSYLGPNGSFTQIALIKYFSDDTKQISKRTIDDVFKSVEIGEADYGVGGEEWPMCSGTLLRLPTAEHAKQVGISGAGRLRLGDGSTFLR